MIKSNEAKQRILDASIKLFGKKGYAAVGVREIAKEANVNISMISYYYDGKVGILKEIIMLYFAKIGKIMESQISDNMNIEDFVKGLFPALVNFMKNNTNLCKVAILEMPYDVPEITEFKGAVLMNIISVVKKKVWPKIGINAPAEQYMPIIGPAIITMAFSNFLIGEIAQKAMDIEFNEEFYDKYSKILSTMFLYGVTGLVKEVNK